MAKLPWAKMSPRIENGVLCWYAGDTFRLYLELELQDQDGTPVLPGADDTVTLSFYNCRRDPVLTLEFVGRADSSLIVDMNTERSALFSPGKYTYDLCLRGPDHTTLIRAGTAIVE